MATTEVAEALESLDFLQEVNVYGVTVPGAKTWEAGGSRPASLTRCDGGTGSVRPAGEPPQQLATCPRLPGHEGRAGMAALVLRPPHALDLVQLYAHVSENLPPYAWPRFLRLQVPGCPRPPLSPRVHSPRRAPHHPRGPEGTLSGAEREQRLPRRAFPRPRRPSAFLQACLFLFPVTPSPKPRPRTSLSLPLGSPEPPGQDTPAFSSLRRPPQEAVATTETFKQQKVRMAKEGFDPGALSDPLYVLDQPGGAYLPLTRARYSALLAGDLRL